VSLDECAGLEVAAGQPLATSLGDWGRREHDRRCVGAAQESFDIDVTGVRPLDGRAECVEERLGWFKEVDGICSVVHRYDESRLQFARDHSRGGAADCWAAADREEEHVDLADCLALFGAQRGLPEVAEVAEDEARRA
jgi:hypothetical protein